MEAMVEQVKMTASDARPTRAAGRRMSFQGHCEELRDSAGGKVIVVVGPRGAERVAWRGPLLEAEVAEGDRLEVMGAYDGQQVRAQRIVNLTQGTVLRPVPPALRNTARGVMVAIGVAAATIVAGALLFALL